MWSSAGPCWQSGVFGLSLSYLVACHVAKCTAWDETKFHLSFLDLRCHFVSSLRWLSNWILLSHFHGFSFSFSLDFCWILLTHFLGVHVGSHCHSVVCPWMIGRLAPLRVYRSASVVRSSIAYGCSAAFSATS